MALSWVVDAIAVVVTDMVDHRTMLRNKPVILQHGSTPITWSLPCLMSRAAKATLIASILASSLTVWGVHYLQRQEHDVRIPFPRLSNEHC